MLALCDVTDHRSINWKWKQEPLASTSKSVRPTVSVSLILILSELEKIFENQPGNIFLMLLLDVSLTSNDISTFN